jgi:membrane protease YdiL (CAAX protease family)
VDDKRVSIDSTVKFALLTYAVTWLGTAIGLSGKVPLYLSITSVLLGTFAPSVVALGMTVSEEETRGSVALLGRLVYWRVAARWYVLAVCYPVAILSGVEIAHRLIAGAWVSLRPPQWFAILTWPQWLLTWTILTLPVIASEEIGWRGYALPRLTKRFGLS